MVSNNDIYYFDQMKVLDVTDTDVKISIPWELIILKTKVGTYEYASSLLNPNMIRDALTKEAQEYFDSIDMPNCHCDEKELVDRIKKGELIIDIPRTIGNAFRQGLDIGKEGIVEFACLEYILNRKD